jgi:hypothetical protein
MPAHAGIQSPWRLPSGCPLPYQVRDKLRGNDAWLQGLGGYV